MLYNLVYTKLATNFIFVSANIITHTIFPAFPQLFGVVNESDVQSAYDEEKHFGSFTLNFLFIQRYSIIEVSFIDLKG